MFGLYKKLTVILDKRELWLAGLILVLTFVVAVIDVLGVASIMPFIAVLANPDVVTSNSILSFIYNFLEFKSVDSFLLFLGVGVFILLVGSTFLRAVVVWTQVSYANLRNFSIGSRLVSGYLRKPYHWYLTNNSSKSASAILEEVARVVHGSLYSVLRLISNLLIALFTMTLFVIVDPTLAIGIALLLGIAYISVFRVASNHLSKSGKVISGGQHQRLKAIQEAFAGIKDVKIRGLENAFLDKYRVPAKKLALNNITIKLWSEMPSFAMQGLVFGGMMAVILYLMKTRGGLDESIPILAMYALGAYKIMPSLQEIYKQLAEIKSHRSALDKVYNDIIGLDPSESLYLEDNYKTLQLNKSIELRDLNFSYPQTDNNALEKLNIQITKNSTIGFVGGSGSGKTTTVDIILGLLEADSGHVYVDDQIIDSSNVRSWQRNIGYVPQQIFLSDDSIAANIAFGLSGSNVDYDEVERAARTANLHDFIITDLPNGYDTQVGERGVRLSGGQRQRIGIARALYYDPEVLILDEATSALDNITEKAVMDAVRELGHKKTIVIVAHRLSTIQSCDKIFLFDNGAILDSGDYDYLINHNPKFREMAHLQDS